MSKPRGEKPQPLGMPSGLKLHNEERFTLPFHEYRNSMTQEELDLSYELEQEVFEFINEHRIGVVDHYDDIYESIYRFPEVVRMYWDFIKEKCEFSVSFYDVFTLIRWAPDYAVCLKPIFDEEPRLTKGYGDYSQGIASLYDRGYEYTGRISTSPDIEVVRAHLEESREICIGLQGLLREEQVKQETDGGVIVASPHGQTEIWIEPFEGFRDVEVRETGVMLFIRPLQDRTDPAYLPFTGVGKVVQVSDTGLLHGRRVRLGTDVGYILFEDTVNGINEVGLVNSLLSYPPNSEELNRALEDEDWFLEYLDNVAY